MFHAYYAKEKSQISCMVTQFITCEVNISNYITSAVVDLHIALSYQKVVNRYKNVVENEIMVTDLCR